tara:strand:+ start:349 stop:522 length:174 start_codon:yes stop_codon:yes gene_type:complete
MNQNFLSIKVFREEHLDMGNPNTDFIMEIIRNGGWPLNCVLMPNTTSLYAETYFHTN